MSLDLYFANLIRDEWIWHLKWVLMVKNFFYFSRTINRGVQGRVTLICPQIFLSFGPFWGLFLNGLTINYRVGIFKNCLFWVTLICPQTTFSKVNFWRYFLELESERVKDELKEGETGESFGLNYSIWMKRTPRARDVKWRMNIPGDTYLPADDFFILEGGQLEGVSSK